LNLALSIIADRKYHHFTQSSHDKALETTHCTAKEVATRQLQDRRKSQTSSGDLSAATLRTLPRFSKCLMMGMVSVM